VVAQGLRSRASIDLAVTSLYLSRVKGGKPLPPAIATDLVKLPSKKVSFPVDATAETAMRAPVR
jgi:hypothetical protein